MYHAHLFRLISSVNGQSCSDPLERSELRHVCDDLFIRRIIKHQQIKGPTHRNISQNIHMLTKIHAYPANIV